MQLLCKYPINVSLIHYEHETSFGGDCLDCISGCLGLNTDRSFIDGILDIATGGAYSATRTAVNLLDPTGCWLNCVDKCKEDVEKHTDAFASKGFIDASIAVDGFLLHVFNTHTDASGSAIDQVAELGNWINFQRTINPNFACIVMGDFNISKDYSPINTHLSPYFVTLDTLGVSDAFSAGCCGEECNAFTEEPNNEIKKAFDPDFNPNSEESKTIDYVFYRNGIGFNMVPISAVVKKYKASSPISDGKKSSKDLSDHYGVVVEFSLTR